MAKLTLADLRKLRDQKQKAMDKRDPSKKDAQVIVGMGTCGIASGGARRTWCSSATRPRVRSGASW